MTHDAPHEPTPDTASDPDPRSVSRRRLLQATGAVGLGAAVGSAGLPTAVASPSVAAAKATDDPVTMAMHIHGSFSEGSASMDAHLYQAERLGIDAIWWTDHDFRRSAFGYRTEVGFDGPSEKADGWDWTWGDWIYGNPQNYSHEFVSAPTSPDEPGKAMQIYAEADPSHTGGEWDSYLLQGKSANFMYSTSYADTTLTLDVLPQQIGRDAQIVVEVASSYRPATGNRPAGGYVLQYRIGGGDGSRHRESNGLLGAVPIAADLSGDFQRITMDLHADHKYFWPDTVSTDAALWRLRIGVRARNGATAQAVVDRLRFNRTRKTPADGLALFDDAMVAYRERYPTVRQFASSEISLIMHLNAFGGDRQTPTYHGNAIKDNSVQAQLDMVDWLHGHGAVVSINHPMQGAKTSAELASRLLTYQGVGADVIEVGTTSAIETTEWVFDVAARNAVFLTANGTTDDHEGTDWLGPGKRWVTGVWSPTMARADLCAALKAGRAWFYDPLRWTGTFDLLADGAKSMGSVLFTDKANVPVTVTVTDLPSNSTLEFVTGVCDLAGAAKLYPSNFRKPISPTEVKNNKYTKSVAVSGGVYVRAMVRDVNETIVGYSNPIWILPNAKRGNVTVPPSRRG